MRTNQIIERLKISPCTNSELPTRVNTHSMGLKNRVMIHKIKISGGKNTLVKHGGFITVFYLEGDEDRGLKKFAEVNAEALASLDFSGFNAIDSGLSRQISQKLRAML